MRQHGKLILEGLLCRIFCLLCCRVNAQGVPNTLHSHTRDFRFFQDTTQLFSILV